MTLPEFFPENIANKVEVHYFFNDDSHSMDAFVKLKCEENLLGLVESLFTFLDAGLTVESEPYQNGGLRQIWKFMGTTRNAAAITIVVNVLTLLLSRAPASPSATKSDLELLQEKNTQLEIKQRQLDIQEKEEHLKIKEKLLIERRKIIDSLTREIKSGLKSETYQQELDKVTSLMNSNRDVAEYRSQFFKTLKSYDKVTQFSSVILTEDNREVSEPQLIKKVDFQNFISVPALYHDEKMPYTFMWWLEKTRAKYSSLYQPYKAPEAHANNIPEPQHEVPELNKTEHEPYRNETLEQQYYESIARNEIIQKDHQKPKRES